jgi:hypothetical protein
MIQISYVAQPTHCSRLSSVGAYEPRRGLRAGASHQPEQQAADRGAEDDRGGGRDERLPGRHQERGGDRDEQADPEVRPEAELVQQAERARRWHRQRGRRLDRLARCGGRPGGEHGRCTLPTPA